MNSTYVKRFLSRQANKLPLLVKTKTDSYYVTGFSYLDRHSVLTLTCLSVAEKVMSEEDVLDRDKLLILTEGVDASIVQLETEDGHSLGELVRIISVFDESSTKIVFEPEMN